MEFFFSKNRKKNKKARRYINRNLSVKDFFLELKNRDINYVVLRWYEELPIVNKDEDIDLLFDDCEIEKIEDLLQEKKGKGVPCDIYSVSGLKGSDYRKMAYYPPQIARKILKSSITYKEYIKVPSPKEYFLAMAYHCVYHKGYDSGLNSITKENFLELNDHNYEEILGKLMVNENFSIENITLESLHSLLKSENWVPPYDTLEKLSLKNEWLKEYILSKQGLVEEKWNGLTVFIVRDKAYEFLAEIQELIIRNGFTILFNLNIPEKNKMRVIEDIRGGNWSKGPFPVSGGYPAYAIIAYDTLPVKPSKSELKQHIGLANKRILKTKYHIRKFINKKLLKPKQYNALHSADNSMQAIEYIKLIVEDELLNTMLQSIEEGIDKLTLSFKTKYPVVCDLSKNTRRAKVELINYNGKEAICKTFKPGMEKYLAREISIREDLSSAEYISQMYEKGDNYIIIKYYENSPKQLESKVKFLGRPFMYKISILKELIKVIETLKDKGYHLIDFQDENIIYDKNEGIKLIDFEVYYKSEKECPKNYTWYRLPKKLNVDVPFGYHNQKKETYYTNMFYRFGIPLSFVNIKTPTILIMLLRLILIPFVSLRNLKIKKRKSNS